MWRALPASNRKRRRRSMEGDTSQGQIPSLPPLLQLCTILLHGLRFAPLTGGLRRLRTSLSSGARSRLGLGRCLEREWDVAKAKYTTFRLDGNGGDAVTTDSFSAIRLPVVFCSRNHSDATNGCFRVTIYKSPKITSIDSST